MGIALWICDTNAKLAIKTEERAKRFIAELFSLFLLFSLELTCFLSILSKDGVSFLFECDCDSR